MMASIPWPKLLWISSWKNSDLLNEQYENKYYFILIHYRAVCMKTHVRISFADDINFPNKQYSVVVQHNEFLYN